MTATHEWLYQKSINSLYGRPYDPKGKPVFNIIKSMRRFLSSPFFIIISIAISFWLGLGWVPLFDLDEGAFTEATREMIASGNYAATFLDGEPRYDKPIFFYWLQAASIHLFGYNEWAFRAPSALMASLWALVTFVFVKQFSSHERAKIATLFLVNGIWIALIARSAIADATLNLFLTLALFDIWRYFDKIQNTLSSPDHTANPTPAFFTHSWLIVRIYIWMALATLTKGPVAVAVPLLVSLLFLLSRRSPLIFYRPYINPLGWLTYIGVVSPWLYAVYLSQGSGFFEGFIIEHNLKRFSDTRESHGGSLFYYFAALPIILIPFSGLLFYQFSKIKRIWQSPLSRFLFIWFSVIFVLFSFSKTQLPHYILNGCVPLILLMSMGTSLFNKARWAVLIPIGFMCLLVFLPQIIESSLASSKAFVAATLDQHNDVIPSTYPWLALLALALMILIAVLPKIRTWQRLSLCGLVLNVFIFTVLVRVISGLQQGPIHQVIAYLDRHAGDETVVAYRMHMPSFSVYREKITPLRAPNVGELVLTRVDRVQRLTEQENTQYQQLFQAGGLLLLKRMDDSSSHTMPHSPSNVTH